MPVEALAIDAAALDAIAARFAARGGQPGLAYGVVAGGGLVPDLAQLSAHLGGAVGGEDVVAAPAGR